MCIRDSAKSEWGYLTGDVRQKQNIAFIASLYFNKSMNNICIVNKRFPQKGKFINEGSYNYITTEDNLPAFEFRWKGMIMPGAKSIFVFSRDVIRIAPLTDEVAK